MICNQCNKEYSPELKHCPYCGYVATPASYQSPVAAPQPTPDLSGDGYLQGNLGAPENPDAGFEKIPNRGLGGGFSAPNYGFPTYANESSMPENVVETQGIGYTAPMGYQQGGMNGAPPQPPMQNNQYIQQAPAYQQSAQYGAAPTNGVFTNPNAYAAPSYPPVQNNYAQTGAPYTMGGYNRPVAKRNGLAIAGFVISLVSLFLNVFGIVAVVGLILSCMGLSQINRNGDAGKGMATAGIVIGIIDIIYGVVMLVNVMRFL